MIHLKTLILLSYSLSCASVLADESVCFGDTGKGRLHDGVALPSSGGNYKSYGSIPEIAGRNYVHSRVRDVIIAAYERLSIDYPNKVFKYAETGFRNGGAFRPHKTHQNGLSVDFIVPVLEKSGRSTYLPTNIFNKYGYSVEFDHRGQYENYRIDFDALGAHIAALHKAALEYKIEIGRVLFAPDLQPMLYASRHGVYIKRHIHIPQKKSWVRHDEHYHVDFKIKCKPLE